jgi:hypothetical protein
MFEDRGSIAAEKLYLLGSSEDKEYGSTTENVIVAL